MANKPKKAAVASKAAKKTIKKKAVKATKTKKVAIKAKKTEKIVKKKAIVKSSKKVAAKAKKAVKIPKQKKIKLNKEQAFIVKSLQNKTALCLTYGPNERVSELWEKKGKASMEIKPTSVKGLIDLDLLKVIPQKGDEPNAIYNINDYGLSDLGKSIKL